MKIFSHLIMAIVCFLIFQKVFKHNSLNQDTQVREQLSEKNYSSRDHSKRSMSSADYREAWQAVCSKNLSKEQRIALQKDILTRWAEIDLHSALTTFFDEYHHGGFSFLGDPYSVISSIMKDHGIVIFEMVKEKKLGPLNSALLGSAWVKNSITQDEIGCMDYIGEMDSRMLGALFESVKFTPDAKNKLHQIVAKIDQHSSAKIEQNKFFNAVGNFFSNDEIKQYISSTQGNLQNNFVNTLAMKLLFDYQKSYQEGDITKQIESLPENQQEVFAKNILKNDSTPMQLFMDTLDYAAQHNQWSAFDGNHEYANIKEMSKNFEPKDVAEWAYSLPARKETTEIFHRSVEPYIQKHQEESWQWIQQMPSGYWKDRALAEYSQQSLHFFKNEEASRAAVKQIGDAVYRKEVEGWNH